jgi:osmoprotectant transport system permease protein
MDIIAKTVAWLTAPEHWIGADGIPVRLAEHVAISGVSLGIAIAMALPLGLWIGHTGRGAAIVVNLANVGRALPSLAVIGIVLPITSAIDPQLGFKVYPTLAAMVVLAVPPILVNAYAGVAGADRDLVEAGRGMGLRGRQILGQLELPVAVPVVVAGLRSAGVQIVATATLGAIFGFGGLGRFLVDGTAQRDDGQIFGGVVLVALLALATEFGFARLQRGMTPPALRGQGWQPGRAPSRGRA